MEESCTLNKSFHYVEDSWEKSTQKSWLKQEGYQIFDLHK